MVKLAPVDYTHNNTHGREAVMKSAKNPVKAQWRPASQPRKVRPVINQLPEAGQLGEVSERNFRRVARALTECDATFKRALPV